jgi:hypothetical protein
MKYLERINQTDEQVQATRNVISAEKARNAVMFSITKTKEEIYDAIDQLESLKSIVTGYNPEAILHQDTRVKHLQRHLAFYETLLVEEFTEKAAKVEKPVAVVPKKTYKKRK